jgi:GR25 family glycosyltransferase involved in LPS biosynthesis
MKQKNWGFKLHGILIIVFAFFIAYIIFTKMSNPEGMSLNVKRSDFDCYVINLEKNHDRLKKFTSTYEGSGLKEEEFIHFKAIYGKDINYEEYISDNVEISMTPGMVGCFLSHLYIYDMMTKSMKDYALIFEDDAYILRDLNLGVISSIFGYIPEDWDIILLGYDISNPVHKYEKLEGYLKMYNFWGTHAYFIKKTAAAKLLDLTRIPFTNQIDHVMGDLCSKGLLNVYGIPNPLVFQDARYTDVQVM